jgi:hypothetical protein
MGSIQFSQNCSQLVSIERSCFFYGHNSEGSFVGASVVEKSTEKGVEKSRLQGISVGPMENLIDYRFNGLFSTHHEMSLKWCQSKGG